MSHKPTSMLQIIDTAIRQAGADGIVNPRNECGCYLGDLVPCDGMHEHECQLGWKRVCAGCGDSFLVNSPESQMTLCPLCFDPEDL